MIVTQIQNGYALTQAVRTERNIVLELLVQAIDYCSDSTVQGKVLSQTGLAGMERLQKLFGSGKSCFMIFPKMPDHSNESVSDILMSIWAGILFSPELSKERFMVYAESAALLCDMLGGGWLE